jgi:hypothetical protein
MLAGNPCYWESVLTVAFAATAIGCSRRIPTTEFILPDGYRGKVVIFVDRANGMSLRPGNGDVRISIPSPGVLKVHDDAILKNWHTPKARYANGTPIPYAPNGVASPLEPMLIDGSSRVEDGIAIHWFYVGTKSDYQNGVGITAVDREFATQLMQRHASEKR